MIRQRPRATRTDTPCPYTPLFRSEQQLGHCMARRGQDLQRLVAGRGGDVYGVLEGITAGGVLALDHAHQRGAQLGDRVVEQHGFHRHVEACLHRAADGARSEEHTSELQSLMRISYAVFCLKKKNTHTKLCTTNNKYDTTTKTKKRCQ